MHDVPPLHQKFVVTKKEKSFNRLITLDPDTKNL